MEATDSSRIESASYVTLRCRTVRMVVALDTAATKYKHASASTVSYLSLGELHSHFLKAVSQSGQ